MSDGDKRGSPTYSKVLSRLNIMFAVNSTINVAAMARNKQDIITLRAHSHDTTDTHTRTHTHEHPDNPSI